MVRIFSLPSLLPTNYYLMYSPIQTDIPSQSQNHYKCRTKILLWLWKDGYL